MTFNTGNTAIISDESTMQRMSIEYLPVVLSVVDSLTTSITVDRVLPICVILSFQNVAEYNYISSVTGTPNPYFSMEIGI